MPLTISPDQSFTTATATTAFGPDQTVTTLASGPAGVPAAPSALVAVALTSAMVLVAWLDNATDETGFSLERATGAGAFAQLVSLAANDNDYVDSSAQPGTAYSYRIRAFNATGNSTYSNTTSATTPGGAIPGVAFSGVTVTGVGQNTATVSWRTTNGGWVLGDATYGVLGTQTKLGPTDFLTDTQVEYGLTTAYGSATTYTTTLVANHTQVVNGLSSGVLYHFRCRSGLGGGVAAQAASGDLTFSTLAGGPNTPSNLIATVIGPTSISLTWTDNATDETAYIVEQAVGAGGSFAILHTLAANATSDTATGLTQGTLYRYRVRCTNASGSSAYTIEASATTSAVPAAPTALTALVQSSTAINLAWTDNATDETSFSIERAVGAGSFSVLTSVAANITTYPDTGLTANTQYSYRVRAVNAVGNSGYTNTATQTTPAGGGPDTTPPVISGVTTSTTSTSFTVFWATDEPADSQIDYGLTTAYGSSTVLDSALLAPHSVTVSPVSPSQLYHYRIRTKDAAGNLATLTDRTVTTSPPADITPPTITVLQVTAITASTATITWTTSENADDTVDYGTTVAYGLSLSRNTVFATSHARQIAGLSASTLYHYRVQSQDPAGNNRVSGDGTFTTLAASGGAGTLPAAPTAGTQQAGAQVLLALTTRPIETPTWVDISQWVRSFTITRGRDSQLSSVSAATATITLDNRDRRFDPTNAAGPYFGNLKKMRRVKIRGGWASAGYDQFTGYVEDFPMQWEGSAEANVELSAVDGFAVLALHDLTRPFAAASGDTRIHEVLDDTGWTTGAGWLLGSATQSVLGTTTIIGSTGDRLISTADAQLTAFVAQGTNALAHIQQVEQSEMGLFFMTKEGQARFRSRHELQQLAAGAGLAIFGELTTGGELLYADAQINAAGDVLYNRALVGREGTQTVQQYQNDASVYDYYARTFTATLLLDSDEPTLGYAQAIVNRFKTPFPVIPLLTLDPVYSPAVMWPMLLGRELGEVVTVRRRPPGGGAVLEQKSRIEGISIGYVAGDRPNTATWGFQWRLSPVGQEGSPWVLGDPTYSVLGTSSRLVY